jgi:hypothetical protein
MLQHLGIANSDRHLRSSVLQRKTIQKPQTQDHLIVSRKSRQNTLSLHHPIRNRPNLRRHRLNPVVLQCGQFPPQGAPPVIGQHSPSRSRKVRPNLTHSRRNPQGPQSGQKDLGSQILSIRPTTHLGKQSLINPPHVVPINSLPTLIHVSAHHPQPRRLTPQPSIRPRTVRVPVPTTNPHTTTYEEGLHQACKARQTNQSERRPRQSEAKRSERAQGRCEASPKRGGPGGRSPARPGVWGPGPQKAPWTTRRSDSEQGRPGGKETPGRWGEVGRGLRNPAVGGSAGGSWGAVAPM